MFWSTKHPRSLALRLSLWYAASSFLLLAAGTGFLYWELVESSNAEDDQYIAEKANTLQRSHPWRRKCASFSTASSG